MKDMEVKGRGLEEVSDLMKETQRYKEVEVKRKRKVAVNDR